MNVNNESTHNADYVCGICLAKFASMDEVDAHTDCEEVTPKQRCYVHTFVTIDKCGCPPDPSLLPADTVVPGELVGEAEKIMADTIFWEPITNKLNALEFRCLVQRMLARLEHRGYELRRIDEGDRG